MVTHHYDDNTPLQTTMMLTHHHDGDTPLRW